MGTLKTSADFPDRAMESTRGIWVRHNLADDNIEIWHDGSFKVSWANASKISIEDRLTAMLSQAVEIGERKAKKEIRAMLGVKP